MVTVDFLRDQDFVQKQAVWQQSGLKQERGAAGGGGGVGGWGGTGARRLGEGGRKRGVPTGGGIYSTITIITTEL